MFLLFACFVLCSYLATLSLEVISSSNAFLQNTDLILGVSFRIWIYLEKTMHYKGGALWLFTISKPHLHAIPLILLTQNAVLVKQNSFYFSVQNLYKCVQSRGFLRLMNCMVRSKLNARTKTGLRHRCTFQHQSCLNNMYRAGRGKAEMEGGRPRSFCVLLFIFIFSPGISPLHLKKNCSLS